MKKQYKNQELYEKTILLDKFSTNLNSAPPQKQDDNLFECKLICDCTQINFVIDNSGKSLFLKQKLTKNNCKTNKKSPD